MNYELILGCKMIVVLRIVSLRDTRKNSMIIISEPIIIYLLFNPEVEIRLCGSHFRTFLFRFVFRFVIIVALINIIGIVVGLF
jgi:hypothetical protein